MKSPTFVKQGLLGLFWREESSNWALFVKLLRHRKLCIHFNILERLISENFLLRSRVSHAYATQWVSSHSDERTSSFTELCTFENRALWCALRCVLRGCVVNLNGFAVSSHGYNPNSVNCILVTLPLLCLTTLKVSQKSVVFIAWWGLYTIPGKTATVMSLIKINFWGLNSMEYFNDFSQKRGVFKQFSRIVRKL